MSDEEEIIGKSKCLSPCVDEEALAGAARLGYPPQILRDCLKQRGGDLNNATTTYHLLRIQKE